MPIKKYINKILEKFFLCTHIPIQAFEHNDSLINSVGFNEKFKKIFNDNKVYNEIKIQTLANKNNSLVTIHCLNNIYFTAYCIHPKSMENILFILGPYSSCKKNKMGIVYKPTDSIKYSIFLLRKIIDDNIYDLEKQSIDKNIYSLHVKKAIDYISLNYSELITLSNISNYLGINKSYFSSIFKKETGKTFTQMLNEIRIEKSKELLLETDLSALDIALSVGFNNQNYYNIVFKKITNETPMEFRHNLRNY